MATHPPRVVTAIDFWGELDSDVLRCLSERPEGLSPAEIGQLIGVSEDAARSILTMLARDGKVRMRSVAYVPDRSPRGEVRPSRGQGHEVVNIGAWSVAEGIAIASSLKTVAAAPRIASSDARDPRHCCGLCAMAHDAAVSEVTLNQRVKGTS